MYKELIKSLFNLFDSKIKLYLQEKLASEFLVKMRNKPHGKISQKTYFSKGRVINKEGTTSFNSQTNLSFEKVRLCVNEKLLYVKTCKQKNSPPEDFFQYYPYNNIESFKFPYQVLIKDLSSIIQNPEVQPQEPRKKVVKDENGLHFVENVDILTEEEISMNKYFYVNKDRELFNGLAISIFDNGKIFEGNYHDGHFCGNCLQINEQGDLYMGYFKDGVKRGTGSYYSFFTKEEYKGCWQNDLPHGQGKYNDHETAFEGYFSNGLKNGFGIQKFNNGDYYAGEYVNGVPEGYGEYYWADGSMYKGDFSHGARHGYGIWQDSNETYFGSYKMDNKEGFGVYTWKNKKVYKGQFKNDYRDGYGELYALDRLTKKLKAMYKGGWQNGSKNPSLQIPPQAISQLYSFLEKQSDLIAQMPLKKQRVGHKNCLPHHHEGGCNHH